MNIQIDITNVSIKTERLLLRPFKESDLLDFYNYAKVEGVGEMAGWSHHKSIEESASILKMFIESKRDLAIVYKGVVIGSFGIKDYDETLFPELDHLKGKEIGYVLNKDYWGNGFMVEVVEAVKTYLFKTYDLDFILVGHFLKNHQSQRVIEKSHFKYLKDIKYQTVMQTIEDCKMYILMNTYR